MNAEFLHMANIVLASRLVYIGKDKPLLVPGLIAMLAIQLAGLFVYQMSIAWTILLVALLVIGFVFYRLERHAKAIDEWRLLSFVLTFLLLSVVFSPWIRLEFNRSVLGWLGKLGSFSVFLAVFGSPSWAQWNPIIMGLLLVANEANTLLRIGLKLLGRSPLQSQGEPGSSTVTTAEYNTGRIIGILERVLIYISVLSGQAAGIGLVLAAKGFVRFKEMDERPFAEYVLIGTLLSLLLAVAVGLFVRHLVGQV